MGGWGGGINVSVDACTGEGERVCVPRVSMGGVCLSLFCVFASK